MLILEVNFKQHLEAFAFELFIYIFRFISIKKIHLYFGILYLINVFVFLDELPHSSVSYLCLISFSMTLMLCLCLSSVFLLILFMAEVNSAGLRQHWNIPWPDSLPGEQQNESMILFGSVRLMSFCLGTPCFVPRYDNLFLREEIYIFFFLWRPSKKNKKTYSSCFYFSFFLAPKNNFLPHFLFFFLLIWPCCLA